MQLRLPGLSKTRRDRKSKHGFIDRSAAGLLTSKKVPDIYLSLDIAFIVDAFFSQCLESAIRLPDECRRECQVPCFFS